jgi:hypothetical protein
MSVCGWEMEGENRIEGRRKFGRASTKKRVQETVQHPQVLDSLLDLRLSASTNVGNKESRYEEGTKEQGG